MSIILYEMPGCIYCKKSKELFSDEIENGSIVLLPSSEAPTGTKAFPFFLNKDNGLSYLGFPSSKTNLYNKLNAALQPKENFNYYEPNLKNIKNSWIGIV
jgi:hypothetical protein